MAKKWIPSERDVRYIKEKFPTESTRAIASYLHVCESTVLRTARELGLRKTRFKTRYPTIIKRPKAEKRRDVPFCEFSKTNSGGYVAKVGRILVHRTEIHNINYRE